MVANRSYCLTRTTEPFLDGNLVFMESKSGSLQAVRVGPRDKAIHWNIFNSEKVHDLAANTTVTH